MELIHPPTSPPKIFKGIALFTPGGDVIYCIDPDKQSHWHLDLCTRLQELLGLPEPPHFLVPYYTATIDAWIDPHTQQRQVAAEAYPPAIRYRTLLNAIFGFPDLTWQTAPLVEGICDPIVLASYQEQFPQLWASQELIVCFDRSQSATAKTVSSSALPKQAPQWRNPEPQGYVLRLFVSGHSISTEKALQQLHQLLDRSLQYPYTIKVIDVRKHPELAEQDQISATPTLIRVWPLPTKRIVGTLNNPEQILTILGVSKGTKE